MARASAALLILLALATPLALGGPGAGSKHGPAAEPAEPEAYRLVHLYVDEFCRFTHCHRDVWVRMFVSHDQVRLGINYMPFTLERVRRGQLASKVRELRDRYDERAVYVSVFQDGTFGDLVAAVDSARDGGFDTIVVAPEPSDMMGLRRSRP